MLPAFFPSLITEFFFSLTKSILMKLSEDRTPWLFMRVYAAEDANEADYVLLHVTTQYLQMVERFCQAALELHQEFEYKFGSLTFYHSPDGFFDAPYSDEEEEYEGDIPPADTPYRIYQHLQENGDEWCYVDMEDTRLEDLTRSEYLDYLTMRVDETSVGFFAYGKHSGVEHWTAGIDVSELKLIPETV